jgi:hypothetical protein
VPKTRSQFYGYTVVHALGWDFFAGYLDGAPFPIDTTAGGVAAKDQNTGVRAPISAGLSLTPRTTPSRVPTRVPAISPIVVAV